MDDFGAIEVDLKSFDLINAWIKFDGLTSSFNVSVLYSNLKLKEPLLGDSGGRFSPFSTAGAGTYTGNPRLILIDRKFMELASILEPKRPPKTDKAAILIDAVKRMTQLRTEAQKLKESKSSLQEKIKELKVEKIEL